nr:hypothetical protein [Microctonus hyperodae filamentous virus]
METFVQDVLTNSGSSSSSNAGDNDVILDTFFSDNIGMTAEIKSILNSYSNRATFNILDLTRKNKRKERILAFYNCIKNT